MTDELAARRAEAIEGTRELADLMTLPIEPDPSTKTIDTPGLVDGMSNEEYHADPVKPGSLSHTGAKKMLPPSCPALYRWEYDHPPPPRKRIFDIGSAVHKLVLGEGSEIEIIDADSYRTSKAQQAQEEAYAADHIPVLTKEYAEVLAMSEAVLAHPIARKLFQYGKGEQSLFWKDQASGVWLRGRLDWLPDATDKRMVIPDLKTAVSSNPTTWARAAADLSYHSQDTWYTAGVKALELDDDPAFVFVVVEKKPPYLVTIIELDDTAKAIGRNLNRWAINLWAECKANDRWPGYADDVVLTELPRWYTRQFDED